jgi:hypothetical protein
MPLERLVDALALLPAEAYLQGIVTVYCLLFLLHDNTRAGLNDGNRNHIPIRRIKLRHAKFFSDKASHIIFSSEAPDEFVSLLKLNLNIDTCSDIEFSQCVNGLLSRLQNIKQSLVGSNFELISGFFVDVRRSVDCEPFDPCRQWNRASHSAASAFHCLNDLSHRLIQHPMIVGF